MKAAHPVVRMVAVRATVVFGALAAVVLSVFVLVRYGVFAFIVFQAVAGLAAAAFTQVVLPLLRR